MNCREAQSELYADREAAPDENRRVLLEGHLAECASCRRIRDDLAAALGAWRTEASRVKVPDAEREWHAVRRRIRGGADAGAAEPARPRRTLFRWIAVPVGAAAAIALTFVVASRMPTSTSENARPHTARVNSVEMNDNNSATMVFVDEKSGWLFVLANDAKQG